MKTTKDENNRCECKKSKPTESLIIPGLIFCNTCYESISYTKPVVVIVSATRRDKTTIEHVRNVDSKKENVVEQEEQNTNKELNKDLFGNIVTSKSDNVYLNKNKNVKDLSNSLETKYCLEIVCQDEREQEEMYNELTKKGFECRILTL